ncbi:MAG: hypothetical protein ACR2QA_14725 [Solirubrobacteraceae bacterium]
MDQVADTDLAHCRLALKRLGRLAGCQLPRSRAQHLQSRELPAGRNLQQLLKATLLLSRGGVGQRAVKTYGGAITR